MAIKKQLNSNKKLEGKENLELNFPGDGRMFLNFWDWAHANDVVCQIKKGKLMLQEYDENSKKLPEREITIQEFFKMVKESILKRRI